MFPFGTIAFSLLSIVYAANLNEFSDPSTCCPLKKITFQSLKDLKYLDDPRFQALNPIYTKQGLPFGISEGYAWYLDFEDWVKQIKKPSHAGGLVFHVVVNQHNCTLKWLSNPVKDPIDNFEHLFVRHSHFTKDENGNDFFIGRDTNSMQVTSVISTTTTSNQQAFWRFHGKKFMDSNTDLLYIDCLDSSFKQLIHEDYELEKPQINYNEIKRRYKKDVSFFFTTTIENDSPNSYTDRFEYHETKVISLTVETNEGYSSSLSNGTSSTLTNTNESSNSSSASTNKDLTLSNTITNSSDTQFSNSTSNSRDGSRSQTDSITNTNQNSIENSISNSVNEQLSKSFSQEHSTTQSNTVSNSWMEQQTKSKNFQLSAGGSFMGISLEASYGESDSSTTERGGSNAHTSGYSSGTSSGTGLSNSKSAVANQGNSSVIGTNLNHVNSTNQGWGQNMGQQSSNGQSNSQSGTTSRGIGQVLGSQRSNSHILSGSKSGNSESSKSRTYTTIHGNTISTTVTTIRSGTVSVQPYTKTEVIGLHYDIRDVIVDNILWIKVGSSIRGISNQQVKKMLERSKLGGNSLITTRDGHGEAIFLKIPIRFKINCGTDNEVKMKGTKLPQPRDEEGLEPICNCDAK